MRWIALSIGLLIAACGLYALVAPGPLNQEPEIDPASRAKLLEVLREEDRR